MSNTEEMENTEEVKENNKQWLEDLKAAVKNEETNIELEEFEAFLDSLAKLEEDDEAQAKANAILEDFNLKADEVTNYVLEDLQLIEFNDSDYKYFEKTMKRTPWTGESVELLLTAYNFVKEARDKARSEGEDDTIAMNGREIYGVLQQLNSIEDKGIDRAARFFNLYESFARPFIRFKNIKERNDRVLQRYESQIQEKIQEVVDSNTQEEEKDLKNPNMKPVK